MKIITKAAAEKYLAVMRQLGERSGAAPEDERDCKQLDSKKWSRLEDFQEKFEACAAMEDDAAPVLAGFKEWDTLRLDGLRSLTDYAAKHLANCKVSLSFFQLETLSESAALALSRHKGGCLGLGGLQSISEVAVIHLSAHENLRLSLPTITPKAARALSVREHQIELREIEELSHELAIALGSCRGSLLLNSLKSEHGLAELLKHRPEGQWTHLNGLESVSDELATAIGQAKCWVGLADGTKISPDAAQRLLCCRNGDLYKGWPWLRKVAKTASKKRAVVRVKPGCPAKAFEWITGGLLVVRAKPATVREALSSGKAAPGRSEPPQDVDVIDEVDSGEWTLARCSLIPDQAVWLSEVLKTQAIHLVYEDTSGVMGYQIYVCGKLTEEKVDDDSQEAGFQRTVDRRFKALGIGVPASAP